MCKPASSSDGKGAARGSLVCFLLIAGCAVEREEPGRFSFAVIDVGQGLAQIGVCDFRAVAWDLGLPEESESWMVAYESLGSPPLEAVAISHTDLDHSGGLAGLPEGLDFTGRVIVSPYEDTSWLRTQSPHWSSRIRFVVLSRGDTLEALPGVRVECLWPPAGLDVAVPLRDAVLKNRYSLCFRAIRGAISVLMPADIDTVAERELSRLEGAALRSGILVVPHHGSVSAVDPVFYGYVRPDVAMLSCAKPPNEYGHPSDEFQDLQYQMKLTVRATYEEGTIVIVGNGEYWE